MTSIEELFAPENADVFLKMLESPELLIKQANETKIPGLANRVNEIYQESGIGAPNWLRAMEEIKQAETQPAEYAKTRLNTLSRDYTYSSLQGFGDTYGKIYADSSAKNLQEIKDLSSYLISNNYMSPNDVASVTSEGTNFATQDMASQYASSKGGSFSDALGLIAPVLLSVVAPGLGSAIGSSLGATGATAAGIGNAVVSGALAEASGGDFVKGALGSAVGSIGQGVVAPSISNALGGGSFGNVAAGTLTGGTIAEILGGDFATGALRGGISSGINDYQQQLRQEQFDTAMTESGLAGQTSVDDIQYPQVADTTIQDVINQISLPIDQAVQAPIVAPEYQDDGVQEITVTAPRYETSPFQYDMQASIDALLAQLAPFKATAINTDINQLVNDLTRSVPAEPDSQPEPVDNSKLIAALDVAKTLTPVALAALLAKNAIGSQESEEPAGFPIIPVPAEWKSPTYNQAFTPSAQLDFGSPALLAGTQWGKPQTFETPKAYNISDVINTLNYDSVPFVQPQYQMPQQISPTDFASQFQSPTVGTNDIIGNLGGKPVSISDIVAGIQSQYG